MKTILMFGLMRSGNHMLVSLILQQFTDYVDITNVKLSFDRYKKCKSLKKTKSRSETKYTGFKDVECVIIGMVNKPMCFKELNKFNRVKDCHRIFLIRCPYNQISSIWKVKNKNKQLVKDILRKWIHWAHIYLNKKHSKLIKILYDDFCSDETNVIDLYNQLGIKDVKEFDGNKLIPFQYSSFQDPLKKRRLFGTLVDCVYHDDPQFVKLFENPAIDKLWQQILQTL